MFERDIRMTIKARYSCRAYNGKPVPKDLLARMNEAMKKLPPAPFGTTPRFRLIAATAGDSTELKGLGTYGFIKNPGGFIVGISERSADALVDFGYHMEYLVLKATELGLGTCWLGGSFSKSRFSRAAEIEADREEIPCVIAFGNPIPNADPERDMIRRIAGSTKRKPFAEILYMEGFSKPASTDILPETMLEGWRMAPSSSNKQPWRLVVEGNGISTQAHLFLERTPGYKDSFLAKLAKVSDGQMVDMGIALAHLELGAGANGLPCAFVRKRPEIDMAESDASYIATLTIGGKR